MRGSTPRFHGGDSVHTAGEFGRRITGGVETKWYRAGLETVETECLKASCCQGILQISLACLELKSYELLGYLVSRDLNSGQDA